MFYRLFTSRKIFVCLLAMGVTALLGACGGGGGDSGPSYPNISYTGVQTEAVIDQTNAADFPFVMLEGSSGSGDVFDNLPVAASINPDANGGIPNPENIKRAVDVISNLIKSQLGQGANVTGVTQRLVGNCTGGGGEAVLSGSDTGSSINATLQMDNYCEYDSFSNITLRMHGRMTVSMSYYVVGQSVYMTDFTMTIEYLKMSISDGVNTVSEEFAGSIAISGLDPNSTDPVVFDISVNFAFEGKIYKILNLQFDDSTGTISGKLYHPDHGYVDIITTTPFVYYAPTEQYCGGALQITGSDGATGSVVIDFTADSTCSTYDICVQVNTDPQICAYGVAWGTEPWPTPAVPLP